MDRLRSVGGQGESGPVGRCAVRLGGCLWLILRGCFDGLCEGVLGVDNQGGGCKACEQAGGACME